MTFEEELESFKSTYGFDFLDSSFLKGLIKNDDKLRKEIDYWGMNETETRSLLMNKISKTLIQKDYPTYGDNGDIDEFFLSMKKRYNNLKSSKTFANFGGDWIRQKDSNSALDWVLKDDSNWVYDNKNNIFLMFGMGFHIIAVNYILRNFYNFKWLKQEEIDMWCEIIKDNLVIHGAMTVDTEYYMDCFPTTAEE